MTPAEALVRALEQIGADAIGCGEPCRHWAGDRPVGPAHLALHVLAAFRAWLANEAVETVASVVLAEPFVLSATFRERVGRAALRAIFGELAP